MLEPDAGLSTEPVPGDFDMVASDMDNVALMDVYGVSRDTVRAWRRATGIHQPRGKRTLPVSGLWDTTMTLGELCSLHGWGSEKQFSLRLWERRPAIHALAKANGQARSVRNLRKGDGR